LARLPNLNGHLWISGDEAPQKTNAAPSMKTTGTQKKTNTLGAPRRKSLLAGSHQLRALDSAAGAWKDQDRPELKHHDISRDIIKSLVSAGFGVSLVTESDIGASFSGVVYREIRDGTGPRRCSV